MQNLAGACLAHSRCAVGGTLAQVNKVERGGLGKPKSLCKGSGAGWGRRQNLALRPYFSTFLKFLLPLRSLFRQSFLHSPPPPRNVRTTNLPSVCSVCMPVLHTSTEHHQDTKNPLRPVADACIMCALVTYLFIQSSTGCAYISRACINSSPAGLQHKNHCYHFQKKKPRDIQLEGGRAGWLPS